MKKLSMILAMMLAAICMLTGCAGESKHYGDSYYEKQFAAPSKGDTMAVFHTNMGDITVKLFPKEAPKTVENFTKHAREGYYDGCLFFRVISDFVIQAGDPTNTGRGGESIWGNEFEDELCPYLSTYYGALAMANHGSNTNSSQFFIITEQDKDMFDYERWNMDVKSIYRADDAKIAKFKQVGGVPYLDYQLSNVRAVTYPDTYTAYAHTVFGQVVQGMDIVEAISNVKTAGDKEITEAKILYGVDQTKVIKDKPLEDVIIQTIDIYTFEG